MNSVLTLDVIKKLKVVKRTNQNLKIDEFKSCYNSISAPLDKIKQKMVDLETIKKLKHSLNQSDAIKIYNFIINKNNKIIKLDVSSGKK